MVEVLIKKLENGRNFDLPFYATEKSAGVDLQAAIEKNITLKPMERILIKTGFAISLPEGYEAQIRPRSGIAYKNGITVLNSPGTIDADYRGEIGVILVNLSADEFVIEPGMRIAQMIISRYSNAKFDLVESLDETQRGEGGFGSTGVDSRVA